MALEADPCQLHTAQGELVARGVVQDHVRDAIVVDAATAIGPWFRPGDRAVLEVQDTDRGTLTYHGEVEHITGRRMYLRAVRLQASRQERVAVRVATDLVIEATVAVDDDEAGQPAPRVRIRVIDLSAHGMRLLSPYEARPDERLRIQLPTPQGMLHLEARVVRADEVPGGWLCGAAFVDVTPREQDVLFAWVLELQRQILRRRASR